VRERLERLIDEMVERGILYEDAVGAFERAFIVKVLDRADGSVTAAAKELRVHRNTLSRKIEELKIKKIKK
jgi:Fis family transcriptional regulator, factor for inversion stimulation protein